MALAQQRPVSLTTLFALGRVSNLPTVWTNVLAGIVLAGGDWRSWRTDLVILAMSLFYVGGMYLNDFYDRAADARERPERPIPKGEIAANAVMITGFAMLAAGVALMAVHGWAAALAGASLAAVIVGYDVSHKGNPLAPAMMGLCRALVYCGASAALTGALAAAIAAPAIALLAFVAGITYAARQESFDRVDHFWPLLLLAAPLTAAFSALKEGPFAATVYVLLAACVLYAAVLLVKRPVTGAVSRAVGVLIAGISLIDASFLAVSGETAAALIACVGFPVTLFLQKWIAGT